MKKLVLFIFLALVCFPGLYAQVGINTDHSQHDPSSMLDVKSTDRGVLIPRMNRSQRNNVANPSERLMIFCTDCGAD